MRLQSIQCLESFLIFLELCPDNASYYGNRSACYMMQGYYLQALDDARKSVKIDSKFIKVCIIFCYTLYINLASSICLFRDSNITVNF